VSQPYPDSKYGTDYGKFGFNPRSLVTPEMTKLPSTRTELTAGTTKGTMHTPGFQGFIPSNPANPKVAMYESGQRVREAGESMLGENYLLNIPRYQGHMPKSARNDKGTRQITSQTTYGRDYSTDRWVHSAR